VVDHVLSRNQCVASRQVSTSPSRTCGTYQVHQACTTATAAQQQAAAVGRAQPLPQQLPPIPPRTVSQLPHTLPGRPGKKAKNCSYS
jgi:hypothetical protein